MKRPFPHLIIPFMLAVALVTPTSASAEHSTHRHWAQLIHDTNDFGYWMTYSARQTGVPVSRLASPAVVNANVARHIGSVVPKNASSGARVGRLTGILHLMNTPSAYRYRVDSYTDARAVMTVRWLFGSNPHTPIARLVWTFSPAGWRITAASYIRTS